jgi:hypothetical protein
MSEDEWYFDLEGDSGAEEEDTGVSSRCRLLGSNGRNDRLGGGGGGVMERSNLNWGDGDGIGEGALERADDKGLGATAAE